MLKTVFVVGRIILALISMVASLWGSPQWFPPFDIHTFVNITFVGWLPFSGFKGSVKYEKKVSLVQKQKEKKLLSGVLKYKVFFFLPWLLFLSIYGIFYLQFSVNNIIYTCI